MYKAVISSVRILLCCIVSCSFVFLLGCDSEGLPNHDITSMSVPFTNCEQDFPVEDVEDVKLFFVDDGSLPYIDVSTYIDLIDPMTRLSSSQIEQDGSTLTLSYNPIPKQYMFFQASVRNPEDETYRQNMVIDFEMNNVTVSSYLFFLFQGEHPIDTDHESVTITDAQLTQGEEITIPFDNYDFTFIQYNEDNVEYDLVPFHVATLLFTNSALYRTYYTGDSIIGGGRCIWTNSNVTSSMSGEDIPLDIRQASYQLFVLSLDYFSAIKQVRNVSSYQELFLSSFASLQVSSSVQYYNNFTKLLYQLDDLHADLPMFGNYSSSPLTSITTYPSWARPIRKDFWDTKQLYYNRFIDIVGSDELPTVQLLDDQTAMIHLYQFTKTLSDDMQGYIDDLPDTIKNVIIDVRLNGGGAVESIFTLLGFMTDEPITFTNQVALDGSSISYTVDVDQQAYDYNWYFLTSNASYSAASIAPLLAKENDIATLIGEPTGGGASAIEFVTLPCGFSYTISGNHTFYSSSGNSELGVSIDIPMTDIWDEQELLEIIHIQGD